MFTSDPTRHLDSDVESAHRPSKPKGRVPLVVTAVGLGFVMASLTVSAGRMAYESSGAPGLGAQDIDDELSTARTPEQKATERAAAVLHAVTGPGEVSGHKTSVHARSAFIAALKRAGLTEAEGDLDSHAHSRVIVKNNECSSVAGGSVQQGQEGSAGQGAGSIVVGPNCDGSATETSQGDRHAFNGAGVPEADDDFEYSDALGDLVGALNPFQSWIGFPGLQHRDALLLRGDRRGADGADHGPGPERRDGLRRRLRSARAGVLRGEDRAEGAAGRARRREQVCCNPPAGRR